MNTLYKVFCLSLSLFCTGSLVAQSTTGGNLMIAENSSMAIYSQHNFAKGNGLITSGMVHTSKVGEKGYLVFQEGSSWIGASKGRFVNGFVKVMHSQPFIFPIGDQDQFRPVGISGAYNTAASYYAKRPKTPLAKVSSNGISTVSDKEYWVVTGEEGTQVSFLWGRESNIAGITKGQLNSLTVVGWKNGQWRIIPSTVIKSIPTDFLGNSSKVASDFDAGLISTEEAIVPNDYDYFTIASKEETAPIHPSLDKGLIAIYPNPVVEDLLVNIGDLKGKAGSIKIYNLDGKEMASRILTENAASLQKFDASNYTNGMYKLCIKIDQKLHTTKFMVSRMH